MIREFPWVPWESHRNGKHRLNSWEWEREWWTANGREENGNSSLEEIPVSRVNHILHGNGNGNRPVGMGGNGNTDCVPAHLYLRPNFYTFRAELLCELQDSTHFPGSLGSDPIGQIWGEDGTVT